MFKAMLKTTFKPAATCAMRMSTMRSDYYSNYTTGQDSEPFHLSHTCTAKYGYLNSQVQPDNSLQIGISKCSQLPVKRKGRCFSIFATDEELELFLHQESKDWVSFLTARSKELESGGVLALNMVTSDYRADRIFEEICRSAKALYNRGFIELEELLNFNFHMCFRSLQDVSDRSLYESLGLKLLRAETLPLTRLVQYEDFLQHGDADRFGREIVDLCRATCEPSFIGVLSANRSDEDKTAICDELWREHRVRVAEHPEKSKLMWATMGIVVRKM